MSVEMWADITEADASTDGERGRGRREGERVTRTELTSQRLVRAAAAAPLPPGRVRAVKGGITVSESTAGSMSAVANLAGFAMLLDAYLGYYSLDESSRVEFLGEHRTYMPVLGVPPLGQGPGDMAAFATIYEIIRKFNHMILVCRYFELFGPQEDLDTLCILNTQLEWQPLG
jgi:hypothetical protein